VTVYLPVNNSIRNICSGRTQLQIFGEILIDILIFYSRQIFNSLNYIFSLKEKNYGASNICLIHIAQSHVLDLAVSG
jgi:hypothetical protein